MFSEILSKLPQGENQSLKAYYLIIFSSIKRMHERAYLLIAQALVCNNAWDDALAVLEEAISSFPENKDFKVLHRRWNKRIALLQYNMMAQGKDKETIKRILSASQLDCVACSCLRIVQAKQMCGCGALSAESDSPRYTTIAPAFPTISAAIKTFTRCCITMCRKGSIISQLGTSTAFGDGVLHLGSQETHSITFFPPRRLLVLTSNPRLRY